jgi:ribosome maturation factor RimP
VTRLLDAYRGQFAIDVSSPGPERPLRTPSHFAGAVGRRVSVRTESGIAGRTRFRGEVMSVGEDDVTLAVPDSGSLHIPYGVIVRANLIDEG